MFIPVESLLKKQTAQLFPPAAGLVSRGVDPVKSAIAVNERLFGQKTLVVDEPRGVVYNVRKNVSGKTSGRVLSVHMAGCAYRCAGCYVDHQHNAAVRESLLHAMTSHGLPRHLIAVPQDGAALDAHILRKLAEHRAEGGSPVITYSGGETLGQRGWLVGNLAQIKQGGNRATIDTMGLALALEPDYLAPFAAAGLQDDILFHVSSKPVLPQSFTQLTNNWPNTWVTSMLGIMHAFHQGFLVAPTGPIDNYWSDHEILTYYALLNAIDEELPRVARSVTWSVGEAFSQNAGQARTMVRNAGFQRPTGKTMTSKKGDREYAEHKFIYSGGKTRQMIPNIIAAISGYAAIETTFDNPAVTNPDYLDCLSRIRGRLMARDLGTMPVYREFQRILAAGPDAPPARLVIAPEIVPVDAALTVQFDKAFRRRSVFTPPS